MITDTYTDTTDSVSAENREGVDLIITQKKRQLEDLDAMIAAALTSEKDLEEEVEDAEMYHFNLTESLASLRKFSSSPIPAKDRAVTRSPPQVPQDPSTDSTQQEMASNQLGSVEHTTSGAVSNSMLHTPVVHNEGQQSVGQFVTRLPKLTLPQIWWGSTSIPNFLGFLQSSHP